MSRMRTGRKMSKSKGNAVDPFDALAEYGADAIRWYFYSNSAPWLPNRFHGKAVVEGQRKFMGTLWNTYAFYVLYANLDSFNPLEHKLEDRCLTVMDRWILSKLNSCVREVDDNLANYRIPETARALQEFVDDLSNWYVRRCRERFWVTGLGEDKVTAYMTLYTCLVTLCKAAAPMVPFMTEDIYQNLVRRIDPAAPESIHLCSFPEVEAQRIDQKLEENMEEVLKLVVLGRAARNEANRKNRQPLANMYVKADRQLEEYYAAIVREELNLKALTFTDDLSAFASYIFKPQLKTLGPKYGKRLGEIRAALASLDGGPAKKQLDETGSLTLSLPSGEITLAPEDLLIETAKQERYTTLADGGITVVLDTQLTPELIEEGFVREIVSKIQSMRKEADFYVADHILVYQTGSEKIAQIMKDNQNEIAGDTLADQFLFGELDGFVKEWDINGEAVSLGVKQVK